MDKSDKKGKKRRSLRGREKTVVLTLLCRKAKRVRHQKKKRVMLKMKSSGFQSSGGWNNWNKASFDGDDEKKNKFLKLMGAKKHTGPTEQKKGGLFGSLKSSIDIDESRRISNDLEKQFDHGLQFRKQMQKGRRGGLGFN
ncbi:small acidic protein family-domain-containing protein [Sporodiniella umbellata]|nr:small acidic protein family-domain-containing protein [Sporodiniella umbellata]